MERHSPYYVFFKRIPYPNFGYGIIITPEDRSLVFFLPVSDFRYPGWKTKDVRSKKKGTIKRGSLSPSIRYDLRWCICCALSLIFFISVDMGRDLLLFCLGRYSIFFGAGNTRYGGLGVHFFFFFAESCVGLLPLLIFVYRHIWMA